MPKIKLNITEDNINELLCSLGYLYPSNEKELSRFNKLYADYECKINKSLDIDKIIAIDFEDNKKTTKFHSINNNSILTRMAARKGNNIPEDIIKKIKDNQDNYND